ncbi:MAG: hypothetical protein RLZ25_1577 [Pseudomonadota bacterium]|jgi:hypothetical protein
MDKLKSGRGGVRDGAGRPKKTTKEKRVRVSITLSPGAVEKLKEEQNQSIAVEEALWDRWSKVKS